MVWHRNSGCRMRDFTWRGYRCATLENRWLRVLLNADRGAEIAEILYKPRDIELLYQAPQGPGRVMDRPTTYLAGGPFRDRFAGGWFDMIPNGPTPSSSGALAQGHHGEACLLSWDMRIVEDGPQRSVIECAVVLRRLPLQVRKRLTLSADASLLTVEYWVRNLSPGTVRFIWGHHPCFGEPFLTEESEIEIGPLSLRLDDLPAGYFETLHQPASKAEITNHALSLQVRLGWDSARFPRIGLWKAWDAGLDYPDWGMRRVLAIEPSTSFKPLEEADAEAISLAPHGEFYTKLYIETIDMQEDILK